MTLSRWVDEMVLRIAAVCNSMRIILMTVPVCVLLLFGCAKDERVDRSPAAATHENTPTQRTISTNPEVMSSADDNVIAGGSLPPPTGYGGDALLTLRNAVTSELNQAVVVEVDEQRSNGRWVFVTGRALTPDRKPIDYSSTKFAGDVEDGVFDDWFCALLKDDGSGWAVVALEIGATDVPYVDWPDRYGVPAGIVMP